jgi:hypothetical protein
LTIDRKQEESDLRKNGLIVFILGALMIFSACAPVQAPAAQAPDSEPASAIVYESAAEIPRISVEEAKAQFDDGTAVFVDSRGRRFYDMQHIAGALPPPEVDPPALDNSIPKDQLIIAYCT